MQRNLRAFWNQQTVNKCKIKDITLIATLTKILILIREKFVCFVWLGLISFSNFSIKNSPEIVTKSNGINSPAHCNCCYSTLLGEHKIPSFWLVILTVWLNFVMINWMILRFMWKFEYVGRLHVCCRKLFYFISTQLWHHILVIQRILVDEEFFDQLNFFIKKNLAYWHTVK